MAEEQLDRNVNRLKKASKEFDKAYYIRFLGKRPKLESSRHWEKANKTTFTLFNVLIDQDLTELVLVLENFPDYIPLVCDHFRYSYSYNENEADMVAASKLIELGEEYITKQFLRNVLAKLPNVKEFDNEEMKEFIEEIKTNHHEMHPIVLKYFSISIRKWMEDNGLHKIQQLLFLKYLKEFEPDIEIDVTPDDKDKEVLIPYAH